MGSQFTETFDSEGGFPGLGSFTIEFRPGTQHILGPHVERTSEIAGGPVHNFCFDTIAVTSQDLGPSPSKSDVLAASMFSGRAERFGLPIGEDVGSLSWSISGPSILAWLGNSESPSGGPGVTSGWTTGTKTLSQALSALASSMNGLSYTVDGSVSSNALAGVPVSGAYDTTRDRINKMIRVTTAATEYRCTPAGTLIFAARGDDAAYRQTPQVMFSSDPVTMRDGDLWAFQVKGQVEYDYGPQAGVVSADGSWGNNIWTGTRGLKDFGGSDTAWVESWLGSSDDLEDLDMEDQYLRVFCRKERMRLEVDAYSLADYVRAGDYVWLHCPEAMLIDPTKQINFAGEETHPIGLRTAAISCPVRDGHGVYVIHNATQYGGANTVERLNDYVVFADDTANATVEFDPMPAMRKLVRGRRWRKGYADG